MISQSTYLSRGNGYRLYYIMQSAQLPFSPSVPQKAQDPANVTTNDYDLDLEAPLAHHQFCEPEQLQILSSQSFYLESFPIQLKPLSSRRESLVQEFDQLIGTPQFEPQNHTFLENSTNQQKQAEVAQPFIQSIQQEGPTKEPSKQVSSSLLPVSKLNISLDHIFETVPLKKNQNLPKYIYGLLEKNLTRFKKQKYFQGHEAFYTRFRQSLKICQESKHSLLTLKWILNDNVEDQYEQKLVRLILRKTLNQKLRKSIIPTKQEKNKMEYLVGTKVYSLRCSHPTLLSRGEYR